MRCSESISKIVESVNGMLFAYNAIDIFFVGDIDIVEPSAILPLIGPSMLCSRERMNVNYCYARRRPTETNMKKTEERITSQLCATQKRRTCVPCLCVCVVSMELGEKVVCHCSKQASTAPVTNQSQDTSYYPLSLSVGAAYRLCFCATFNFFLFYFFSY